MATKSLITERLLLREIQPADAAPLAATSAIRMIEDAFLHHDTRPLAEVYVEQAIQERLRIPRRRFELAIVRQADRRVIGACSIKILRSVLIEADLGYILHPEVWNQGYATEAAQRLLEFAFRELSIFRITAHCERDNLASIRVLRKIGMSPIGEKGGRLHFALVRPMNIPLAQNQSVAQSAYRNL